MRWTVIGLVLLNIVFGVWGGLSYRYTQSVAALGAGETLTSGDMPGQRLVLLRERPDIQATGQPLVPKPVEVVSAAQAVSSPAPSEPLQAAAGGEQICTLLGPLPQSADAKALLSRLAALQIHAKYVSLQVEGSVEYWVYLRPEPTKELAIAKLRELQDKKVDSFIIPQGNLANGISLGIFDKKENAESRQQAVMQAGYDAQMREHTRTYLENWVAIYPDQVAGFSPELYSRLKEENTKLDLRKDECRKVASVIDIQ